MSKICASDYKFELYDVNKDWTQNSDVARRAEILIRRWGVDFQKLIRQGLAIILKKIEDETGNRPDSCAILAPYGAGVARITAALSAGDKPIPHSIYLMETRAKLHGIGVLPGTGGEDKSQVRCHRLFVSWSAISSISKRKTYHLPWQIV